MSIVDVLTFKLLAEIGLVLLLLVVVVWVLYRKSKRVSTLYDNGEPSESVPYMPSNLDPYIGKGYTRKEVKEMAKACRDRMGPGWANTYRPIKDDHE